MICLNTGLRFLHLGGFCCNLASNHVTSVTSFSSVELRASITPAKPFSQGDIWSCKSSFWSLLQTETPLSLLASCSTKSFCLLALCRIVYIHRCTSINLVNPVHSFFSFFFFNRMAQSTHSSLELSYKTKLGSALPRAF